MLLSQYFTPDSLPHVPATFQECGSAGIVVGYLVLINTPNVVGYFYWQQTNSKF